MNTAADLVERSVSETLTYYAFPDIHWQKIRTNNRSSGSCDRFVGNLAGPSPLHHDAVEIQIRMLAFDPPIPPRLDFWRRYSC